MKVVEIYESIQGEGPHVGQPTTFVRFGSCNLRCPGWGEGELPDGSIVQGCDTIFAVYPEWRHTWKLMSPFDIMSEITTENVTFTGGEPFIQRSKELEHLRHGLIEAGYSIDIFTNGTQSFPNWVRGAGVTLIVDYKLPGSGEYNTYLHENTTHISREKDAMKFVCKDENDFMVAIEDIAAHGFDLRAQIYFGVVWDVEFTNRDLSALILEHAPFAKLNIQVHNLIWPALERRR